MGTIFLYASICLAATYSLWILFLAVMNLKRVHDIGVISKIALRLGYPILALGFVMDAAVNIAVASVLFLELPRELTVTARLTRHIEQRPTHWRGKLSMWIAINLLDAFDPNGIHR